MKNTTLIVTAALLTFITSSTSAKIYKWVDDEGRLHYTERPAPAGKKAEDIEDKIRFAASLPTKPGSSPYMPSSTEDAAPDSNIDEEKAKNEKANQEYLEKLHKYCETQQHNLATLKTDSPIAWEEDGKTELLTDDQRGQKIREIKESLSKNCSPDKGKEKE